MDHSILADVRAMIGPDTDTTFDNDLIIHINSLLSTLAQVGACPKGSFITGVSDKWSDIFEDTAIGMKAKTFIYYKTRLAFDPPQSSYAMENLKELAAEEIWRINSDADYS